MPLCQLSTHTHVTAPPTHTLNREIDKEKKCNNHKTPNLINCDYSYTKNEKGVAKRNVDIKWQDENTRNLLIHL